MNAIPPLWNSLQQILIMEKCLKYLPKDISAVITRLIQIRTDMFRNSTQRKDEDYVDYDWDQEGEVATQYYPNWRIIRWPRTYSVPRSRTSCNKKYPGSKGFSFGFFTVTVIYSSPYSGLWLVTSDWLWLAVLVSQLGLRNLLPPDTGPGIGLWTGSLGSWPSWRGHPTCHECSCHRAGDNC